MPRGTYLHLDERLEERFQCAPGAGGWRYVGERDDGTRTDLVVDARWRQIRVEFRAPDWWIRGGVTGHDLAWVRGTEEQPGARGTEEHLGARGTEEGPWGLGTEEFGERAAGFLGKSPGFLVAVARSLHLAPGDQADVRLVQVDGTALSTLSTSWRWRLVEVSTHVTETEPLPVERYEVADLATAEATTVHLAGDVVLDAPGIELTTLESPPNLSPTPDA